MNLPFLVAVAIATHALTAVFSHAAGRRYGNGALKRLLDRLAPPDPPNLQEPS